MDTANISSTPKDIQVLKDRDCDHTSIDQIELKTNLFIPKIVIMARHSTVIMNMVNNIPNFMVLIFLREVETEDRYK